MGPARAFNGCKFCSYFLLKTFNSLNWFIYFTIKRGVRSSRNAPNVFITDGACMTSSSCVNPSLTYMAMTARAADFAVKELKKMNL